MRLDRRSFITGIGATGAALTSAGCVTSEDELSENDDGSSDSGSGDGGGDDAGSAHLWHGFPDAEADDLVDYIEEFESETGHRIDHEELSELEEQLNTALPVGEGPHTFSWAHDWVGPFEDRGWLYDAGDDLTLDVEATYIGAGQSAVTWEDGVYGLPFAAETVGLLYNRDLVDSPPETVAEMVGIMEEYHDPAAGQSGISYPLNDPYFVSAWIHAFGGFYYDAENDELGLERDDTIEGLELLMDSFAAYAPADPEYESQVAVFNDGNAPFAINGPWQVGGFRDAGIDVGVSPLPTVSGGDPSPYTGVQMWYFTSQLEGDDETVEVTREFAEWYTTNEDLLLNNADRHGYIPVHAEVAESDELGDDTAAFAESVDMGVPMPASPKMDQVWVPVEDALTRILNDDQGPREAFEQAADEVRDAWAEQGE